jgi:hypothetical protein
MGPLAKRKRRQTKERDNDDEKNFEPDKTWQKVE